MSIVVPEFSGNNSAEGSILVDDEPWEDSEGNDEDVQIDSYSIGWAGQREKSESGVQTNNDINYRQKVQPGSFVNEESIIDW